MRIRTIDENGPPRELPAAADLNVWLSQDAVGSAPPSPAHAAGRYGAQQ